jgi:glycosyltransferase involved in cell wall biosynthesis
MTGRRGEAARAPVAIAARAAIRAEAGGVERVARELARRLPALAPGRYRVVAPPRALAHRAGHAWEQLALPLAARGSQLVFSPGNTAPLTSARNVVFVHDLAPLVGPRWYGRAYGTWHRAQLRAVARRARLAIVPSETVRAELAERLGMDPERIAVAPLGVDPAFAAATDPAALRARLGLDRPYVLAVGTAIARKNLALLDRIGPLLDRAGLDAVIAGGARTYMRGGGRSGGARHLGHVPEADLPALYAGAAAFAIPSLYEGFGLPCLEAMAAGTPVVTTRRGALPETCADAALYVDPDDPGGFAAACVAAATDPAERERLTRAGRARAARFTWDRTAIRVDEAIGAVLALP